MAPNVYEATARVVLHGTSMSELALDRNGSATPASFASGQVQLETLADVFRSDQLAWKVITDLKLYQAPGMTGSFARRFPGFSAAQPSPDARAWLQDKFQRDLTVQTIPRTLVLRIAFRSHDAGLSAAVVNGLIQAYEKQETEERVAGHQCRSAAWLTGQLDGLKARVDRENLELADFQKKHGILNTPETLGNGQPTEVEHTAELSEVDALSRELVSASTDRILREAGNTARATSGDPEVVLASDPRLQAGGTFATALLQQLRARHSDLEQEQTQPRIDHGPNFPRVVEIQNQMQDLDLQIKAGDAKLVERFHTAWKTAADREQMLRKHLAEATGAGLKLNEAALKYVVMRQEANASHDVYVRVMQQSEEAGLAAASHSSDISVIDYARQPVNPVSPDLPVYMAITLFVSLWIALSVVLMRQSLQFGSEGVRCCWWLLVFTLRHCSSTGADAEHIGASYGGCADSPIERDAEPAEREGCAGDLEQSRGCRASRRASGTAQPKGSSDGRADLGAGDALEVSEARTPDLRTSVRVSAAGSVTLPLAGEVRVAGMDELAAAHAIESALIGRGMLLHPQVTVLVTVYAAQDVSVLGEVARPGVYSYAVHHRLLDLISAASGLSTNAGRLVFITHRDYAKSPLAVVLDPSATDVGGEHNPELTPGDTIQVSRAGLVYVVGDVIRPGGFPVDQVQDDHSGAGAVAGVGTVAECLAFKGGTHS